MDAGSAEAAEAADAAAAADAKADDDGSKCAPPAASASEFCTLRVAPVVTTSCGGSVCSLSLAALFSHRHCVRAAPHTAQAR